MKFSTREDIDVPLSAVYRHVTDFDALERLLTRRGVAIERDASRPMGVPGARWMASFAYKGRSHNVESELVALDPEQGYAVESRSGGVVSLTVVDLVALSPKRTRLLVSLELTPTTLSSRLMIQSLRLAKGRLNRRFKSRVGDYANGISV